MCNVDREVPGMKKVILTSQSDLDIYMSPMRQRLIRELSIAKVPMTAKMLADKLQISASGVQHHIKKLMSLGLVELDRTERGFGFSPGNFRSICGNCDCTDQPTQ